MAELRLHAAEIRLSAKEKKALTDSLTRLMSNASKKRTAELEEKYISRLRYRGLLERELLGAQVDVDRLREAAAGVMGQRDAQLATRGQRAGGLGKARTRGTKGGRRQAVWGLSSGSEILPYDFNWTFHDAEGTPVTGNMRHTADVNTGALDVYAHAHDSSPKMVDSYAGVGFWYIPNRSGVLTVGIAPPLNELMWTGASWNDVGAAGGWISLGIARYLRDPFRFVEWNVIDTDELWWNEDNWFDFTTHDRDRSAYGMSATTIADTSHYYACWAWIEAYAYARDGGSYAGSSVQAQVGSFTYSFL